VDFNCGADILTAGLRSGQRRGFLQPARDTARAAACTPRKFRPAIRMTGSLAYAAGIFQARLTGGQWRPKYHRGGAGSPTGIPYAML
jgi:hypothetical protein